MDNQVRREKELFVKSERITQRLVMKRINSVSNSMIEILAIVFAVCGIMLMVYYQKDIYPFGSGTVAYADMIQQTIPENLYYMWDVFHGKTDFFFSWNSGLGINISGAASEQAYLSPLNLFILFSPRENLLNFINILLIIKMVCIAVAMYFYLKKYKVTGVNKICAGILYAFGASSLIHYNLMFVMDMAFLLPILMIGYDRLLNKKKCGLFIAVCTLCLIENAYMSYMVLLFVLLASGVHILCSEMTRKDKGEDAFLLGVSVVISVMLSAVIMLPAMIAISKSSRVQASFMETYLKAVNSSWSAEDWNMAKYMLINMTFPMVIVIYNWKVRKTDRVCFRKPLILIVLMLIPIIVSGTELLWHGGSRVNWPVRFVFIISFVVIDFAMQLLQDMNRELINHKKTWIVYAIAGIFCGKVVYYVFSKELEMSEYKELMCMAITCFCGAGYLWNLCSNNKKVGWSVLIASFEVFSMAQLFIAPGIYNTNEYSVDILRDVDIIEQSLPEPADAFERIKNSDGSLANVNYALVMGRESLANFIHVIDASFQSVLWKWGYSIHYTRLLDTGGTILTDTLFGIEYLISRVELSEVLYDKISECDGSAGIHYYVYKNKYSLPLVAYLENDLPELSDTDFFANQNTIFKSLTGFAEDLIEKYDYIKPDKSTVLDIKNRKVLYMYSEGNRDISIKVNGEDVFVPSMQNVNNLKYPSNFNNNLICLGCYENRTVTIDFMGVQKADGIYLGILDLDLFEKGVDHIGRELWDNVKISRDNSSVLIELDNDRDRSVFVPIFYDDGWLCNVNGNRQLVQDGFGFIKVNIQEGHNLIRLKYVPPGRKTGSIVTVAGMLVSVVFILGYGARKQGRCFCYIYRVSYFMFVWVFGSVVILLYIIPAVKYLERLLIRG